MKTKWFKIWTEDSKNDQDDNQFYLRLLPHEDGDILLAITKKDGELYEKNVICELNEEARSVFFHGIDYDLPIKTDLYGNAIHSTYIDACIKKSNYVGSRLQMSVPPVLNQMVEQLREASQKQMDQHEKETKH